MSPHCRTKRSAAGGSASVLSVISVMTEIYDGTDGRSRVGAAASRRTVNEALVDSAGFALRAQARCVADCGSNCDQETNDKILQRRRNPEGQIEIVAEHPTELEVLVDPLPERFQQRGEDRGCNREQRERLWIGPHPAAV